jgi:hypothetical protein
MIEVLNLPVFAGSQPLPQGDVGGQETRWGPGNSIASERAPPRPCSYIMKAQIMLITMTD